MEVIELTNGLKLEVWDFSLKIAGDRRQVALVCRIEVDLDHDFTPKNDQDRMAVNELTAVVGPTLNYIFRNERNFIAADRKDSIWREMLETFKKDSLAYLSHPLFAYRLVLSSFAKLKKDPFRFRTFHKNSFFSRQP